MLILITIQSAMSSTLLSVSLAKGVDKIIHFNIFGLAGWLFLRGMFKEMGAKALCVKRVVLFIALFALFAWLDELHQARVPGRVADWRDWLADILGVISFMFLFKYQSKK